MEWAAVTAITTIILGGLTLLGGFFAWLARQFKGISDHLTDQDVKIGGIETDIAWIKRELDGKQDKEDA